MCSIGWIKLEDRWLIFKNRDRLREEKNRNNFIEITKDAVLFKDKKMPGAWFGLNKYGLAIATAWGPVTHIPRRRVNENFSVVELLLQQAKSAEEAKNIYPSLAAELSRSFNLIFADQKHAYDLEQIRSNMYVGNHVKSVFKTNHFEHLRHYNLEGSRYETSKARLKKMHSAHISSVDDILSILSDHHDSTHHSLIRKDDCETIASAVFEVKGKDVAVYYALNCEPEKSKYKTKKWKLK